MTDLLQSSLYAMSTGSSRAAVWVFGVGVLSSAGPCVAPRLIAIGGFGLQPSRAQTVRLTLGFIAGLTIMYSAFGLLSSLLVRVSAFTGFLYGVLAVLMLIGGVLTLVRPSRNCIAGHNAARTSTLGGAFLIGAASALVVSPCCTPLLLSIVAYTSSVGRPVYGAMLLACFALGHALPLLMLSIGATGCLRIWEQLRVREAASVVSGALMVFLALYYAVQV
ncbi:MAG: hypothetical protein M3Y21_05820 [Candidatus Eremiobacteraeota bacterium]|nr:hypothetical protein [Candidatus Eremiobacteraeota bacterium]